MGRWKSDAREFTVKVSYVQGRGYQLYFPVPLMERWGRPEHLTFRLRGEHAVVGPASNTYRKRKKGRAEGDGDE